MNACALKVVPFSVLFPECANAGCKHEALTDAAGEQSVFHLREDAAPLFVKQVLYRPLVWQSGRIHEYDVNLGREALPTAYVQILE